MYIEASSPRKPGENAKLVVTVPKKGKQSCISFYYHMYGASAGSLNVYNGNDKVFNVSGNQGNRWVIVEQSVHLDSEASDVCVIKCLADFVVVFILNQIRSLTDNVSKKSNHKRFKNIENLG